MINGKKIDLSYYYIKGVSELDRNIMHDKMKENAIKILKKWKEKIMKQLIKLQKKDIDRRIELDFLMLKNSIEQKIKDIENYHIPRKKMNDEFEQEKGK